jgi:starch synthase (maltosyl-transferring)
LFAINEKTYHLHKKKYMKGQQRVIIEKVKPQINGGEFPIKRVVNDQVLVSADIFCDGHDVLGAEVLYRSHDEENWQQVTMDYDNNDRWEARFNVSQLGTCFYTIRAWIDHFKTWHRDLLKKIEAEVDYGSDLLVGAQILNNTISIYGQSIPS